MARKLKSVTRHVQDCLTEHGNISACHSGLSIMRLLRGNWHKPFSSVLSISHISNNHIYGDCLFVYGIIRNRVHMMTSSNGNIFRVTGHLCGESPPPTHTHTQASYAELCCYLRSPPPPPPPPTHTHTHTGQLRGALLLSSICIWISDWVFNFIFAHFIKQLPKECRVHCKIKILTIVSSERTRSGLLQTNGRPLMHFNNIFNNIHTNFRTHPMNWLGYPANQGRAEVLHECFGLPGCRTYPLIGHYVTQTSHILGPTTTYNSLKRFHIINNFQV